MSIKKLRKKIDDIDEKILCLIKERMSLMPQVANFKKEKGLPIRDLKREKELIDKKKALAKKLGLNPLFAEKIFTNIIVESKCSQIKTIPNLSETKNLKGKNKKGY